MAQALSTALILPGAVAKGAYEAGVIEVLAEREVAIDRIVATSSGALNAVAFAAGIRSCREKETVKLLSESWLKRGSWHDSLHLNPIAMIKGKGVSDHRRLFDLLRGLVKPCTTTKRKEISLRIVVAPLRGIEGSIGDTPATTYEGVLHFSGKDFDSEEGLERVFHAAAAACAFPGLFSPVNIPGFGPCVDGGAVNNTPIRYALQDPDIDRVIVPVPFPPLLPAPDSIRGIALIEHILEGLINERLYRDLKYAETTNRWIGALDSLVAEGVLSESQLQRVKLVFSQRRVEIVEVRPYQGKILKGGLFSGFLDRNLRSEYLEEGRRAALNREF